MSKIKQIIFALSMIFMFCIGISSAKANVDDTNLVKDRFQNVYGVFDGYEVFFGQRYLMNDTTAYCLEPGVAIDSFTYSSTEDWSITGLSNEVKTRVRLIAYYGYDYPNHQNYRYYIAAQELIWQEITGRTTYWVTENRADGPVIDISFEKNEILSLVNNHYTTPSFDNNLIEVNMGDEITINDDNGVLSEYEIYSSNLRGVEIVGNTLKVTSNNIAGDEEIQFIKKNYTNKVMLIYYSGANQKMASSGILDPVIANVGIKTTAGNITGEKLDSETGSTAQGDATLSGAKYGIYNSNNELVDTLITGTNNTSKQLPYGTYTIKELEASKGYELSDKVDTIIIDSNNQTPTIKLYENVIKQKYNFYKVFASAESTILEFEKNVKFNVYLKSNNELYTTFTTDENGFAQIELPYGTYVIKQMTSATNYNKVDDFEIVVDNSSNEVKNMILSDAEITARLKVIKVDKDTGNVIKRSNIKFRIKNVDTNKYVCQTITYPSITEVCEYSTNSDGEFLTPYPLSSGKYLLYEVDQKIDGYLWNQESVEFEIGENSQLITDNENGILFETHFENKQVMGRIVINKIGEEFVIEDGNYHYEEIKLDNVVYELYASEDIISADGTLIYNKDKLVGTYKTKNGMAKIDNLYLGKYYIVEKTTDNDHVIDNEKHYVELKYKDQYTAIIEEKLTLNNYLKKGTIEITKTDLVDGQVIGNTELQIFTENNELIFTGLTDDNGKITIDNLKTGKYYIIESNPATGYVITDEIVYFEIKENDEIVKAKMTNKPITGTVEITKEDISTSEPLPNTLIEVFNDKDEKIFSGRTGEDGKIIIENLRYGKYYFIESEAPEGYTLNPEKMYFEIIEDGVVVKCTMVDEKVVIEVPNTGINDKHIFEIVGVVSIISGIGVVVYDKKKKRK